MAEKPSFSERVIVDNRSGSYEMRIKNLNGLKHRDCIQTNAFKIGSYEWKLLVFRCSKGSQPDRFAVQLLSCNANPLSGDICLSIMNDTLDKSIVSGYRSLNVKPYGFAGFLANVAFDHLIDDSFGFLVDGELKLTADIWNVRTNGLKSKRRSSLLINWEGLSRESIEDRLAAGKHYGIASKTRQRTSLGFSNERIRDFVKERPKFRYWLCDRTQSGEVVFVKCLDDFGIHAVFDDISKHEGSNLDWITVFREKRTESIDCPLPDRWIVVFCKRYDMEQEELWYLDHIFAQETDLCDHLRSRIIHLAQVSQMAGDLFIESDRSVHRIENLKSTLSESGIRSGSVAVIEVRPIRQDTMQHDHRSIEALYSIVEETSEAIEEEEEIEDHPDEGPSDLCVICLDAERTVGFLHGTSVHKCVCKKCGEKIMKRYRPTCPICRRPARQLITNVYSP